MDVVGSAQTSGTEIFDMERSRVLFASFAIGLTVMGCGSGDSFFPDYGCRHCTTQDKAI